MKTSRWYYYKKLRKHLSEADPEAFYRLVWSVDALQSGRETSAAEHITFPQQAMTKVITSDHFVYKWSLETLCNEVLLSTQPKPRNGRIRYLRCDSFEAITKIYNVLRDVEDADEAEDGIFKDLNRLALRQFEWQRGFANVELLYRFAFLFGGDKCANSFESRYGISISQFMLYGFYLWHSFHKHPSLSKPPIIGLYGLNQKNSSLAMSRMMITLAKAKEKAKTLRTNGFPFVAYRPSVLREYSCIHFNDTNNICAPLGA